MQGLSYAAVAAKAGIAVSTVYAKVRNRFHESPPFPAPVSIGRRRVFLQDEIDAYLTACAAARDTAHPSSSKVAAAGRAKFWEDVRAGIRQHPRTVGRLRREAAEAPLRWIVTSVTRDGRTTSRIPFDDEQAAQRFSGAQQSCGLHVEITLGDPREPTAPMQTVAPSAGLATSSVEGGRE